MIWLFARLSLSLSVRACACVYVCARACVYVCVCVCFPAHVIPRSACTQLTSVPQNCCACAARVAVQCSPLFMRTQGRVHGCCCAPVSHRRRLVADGHDFSLTVSGLTEIHCRPVPALLLLVLGIGRFASSVCVCVCVCVCCVCVHLSIITRLNTCRHLPIIWTPADACHRNGRDTRPHVHRKCSPPAHCQ